MTCTCRFDVLSSHVRPAFGPYVMHTLSFRYPAIIVLTLLLVACAHSTPEGTRTQNPFHDLVEPWDLNKDGSITCDETRFHRSVLFDRADADDNGLLESEEFRTLALEDRIVARATLSDFDQNADGRVSLAEFEQKPNPVFARLDHNGDCVLTPAELAPTSR
jgi:EF hand